MCVRMHNGRPSSPSVDDNGIMIFAYCLSNIFLEMDGSAINSQHVFDSVSHQHHIVAYHTHAHTQSTCPARVGICWARGKFTVRGRIRLSTTLKYPSQHEHIYTHNVYAPCAPRASPPQIPPAL